MNEVIAVVRRVQRRLDYVLFLERTLGFLFYALLLFLGIVLLDKAFYLDWNLPLLFEVAIGGCAAAAALLTFARPVTPLQAAVAIEERLRLKQRFSSVITLEDPAGPAASALVADAVVHSRGVRPHEHFTIQIPRKVRWLPAVGGLVLAGVFIPWQPDFFGRVEKIEKAKAHKSLLRKEADALQERLETLRREAKARDLKGVEKILEEFSKSSAALKEGARDPKSALAEINKLADEAKAAAAPDKAGEAAKRAFARNPQGLELMEQVRKEVSQGNAQQAAAELEALRKKLEQGMTDEEKEKLKAELEKMAQALRDQKAAAPMADMLGKAADALSKGDSAKAGEELEKMQKELQGQAQKEAGKDLLQKAAQALQQAKQGVLEQDKDQPPGQGQGQNQPPGNQGVDPGDVPGGEGGQPGGGNPGGGEEGGEGGEPGGQGRSPPSNDEFGEWAPGDPRRKGGEGENPAGGGGGGPGIGEGGRSKDADPGALKFKKEKINAPLHKDGKILSTEHVKGMQLKGLSQAAQEEYLKKAAESAASAIQGQRIPWQDREMVKEYFDELQKK